jgi:CRISPR-associated endonuclease/helicase Cas3
MAGEPPPSDNTRCIETTLGIIYYSELIPLLAERVLRVEQNIARGKWQNSPFDWDLACQFHSGVCGDLIPDWAGRERTVEVAVGLHTPPASHEVRMLMRNYFADIEARLDFSKTDATGELVLELLAFVEGRFLTIHPFQDFNGRVIRLLLQELCQRLDFPAVDLVPTSEGRSEYLQALRAADKLDWSLLKNIWRKRLEF